GDHEPGRTDRGVRHRSQGRGSAGGWASSVRRTPDYRVGGDQRSPPRALTAAPVPLLCNTLEWGAIGLHIHEAASGGVTLHVGVVVRVIRLSPVTNGPTAVALPGVGSHRLDLHAVMATGATP